MRTRRAMHHAAAAAITMTSVLIITATDAGALPKHPSPAASCVATVTVAETRIAPGFVGQEVTSIVELGRGALPSLVRSLAGAHLGDREACAALAGE